MIPHLYFMQQAMSLAESARYHAPPNPWVGCVIVKEGQIIGQGFTQSYGHEHAEVIALQQAKENARDSTLYVTLEPCAHFGKTPPCAQAIIQARVREVYFGIQDPDQRVRGKGIALLQQAGIKVFQGICEKEIEQTLTPYLYQRRKGVPYTILKAAMSLDGRTAAVDLSSQWITCPEARQDAHMLRGASQAILIGAGTALKDLPQLTVRYSGYSNPKQPLRVLLDAKGVVPARGPLFDFSLAPTLVITTSQCSESRSNEWKLSGAEVVTVSSGANGVDLQETWKILGSRDILQVLVEGGSFLHTSLLETSLANRLTVYIGPLLLGKSGYPFYQKEINTLLDCRRLSLIDTKKIGKSVRLDYELA